MPEADVRHVREEHYGSGRNLRFQISNLKSQIAGCHGWLAQPCSCGPLTMHGGTTSRFTTQMVGLAELDPPYAVHPGRKIHRPSDLKFQISDRRGGRDASPDYSVPDRNPKRKRGPHIELASLTLRVTIATLRPITMAMHNPG